MKKIKAKVCVEQEINLLQNELLGPKKQVLETTLDLDINGIPIRAIVYLDSEFKISSYRILKFGITKEDLQKAIDKLSIQKEE